MMVVRRTEEGLLEVSHKSLAILAILFAFGNALFAAGGAWMSVRVSLDKKLDKSDFAMHTQQTMLELNRLHFIDSLQMQRADEDRERIRQIVCYKVVMPACR